MMVASTLASRTGGSRNAHDETYISQLVADPVTTRPYADRGPDNNIIADDIASPLTAGSVKPGTNQPGRRQEDDYNIVAEPIIFDSTQITHPENRTADLERSPSLAATAHPPTVAYNAIRRLTPREAERLQGMPDDYTLIDYPRLGKLASDTQRYRAIGNSMAVPVVAWLGRRIKLVEEIVNET